MTPDPLPLWHVQTSNEAAEESRIADSASVEVITGVTNVEDLLLLPNSTWVIGSGYNWEPARNFLHLFDSDSQTGVAVPSSEIFVRPDNTTYPGCAAGMCDVRATRPGVGHDGGNTLAALLDSRRQTWILVSPTACT
jgi:hypothetical protein